MKLKSNLLGTDVDVSVTEDGLNIITHDTLRRIVRENSRISVKCTALLLSPEMCVFEATAVDEITGRIEVEIGESNPLSLKTEISKENPAIMAQYRAYDRALIQLLDLPSGKVYSNNEIQKLQPKKPDTSAQTNQKPKKIKSVYGYTICQQNNETFIIYDDTKKTWVKKPNGNILTFPSEEKAEMTLKQQNERGARE